MIRWFIPLAMSAIDSALSASTSITWRNDVAKHSARGLSFYYQTHMLPNEVIPMFSQFHVALVHQFRDHSKKTPFFSTKMYETKWTDQNGAIKFQMTLLQTSCQRDKINDQSIDCTCMWRHQLGALWRGDRQIKARNRIESKDSGRDFQTHRTKIPIIASTWARNDLSPLLMRFSKHFWCGRISFPEISQNFQSTIPNFHTPVHPSPFWTIFFFSMWEWLEKWQKRQFGTNKSANWKMMLSEFEMNILMNMFRWENMWGRQRHFRFHPTTRKNIFHLITKKVFNVKTLIS